MTVVQTQWCRRASFKEPIYTMWQYESQEWQKIKSKTCWWLLKYLLILTFVSLEWKCEILLLYIWIIDKFTLQKKIFSSWWKCSCETLQNYGWNNTYPIIFFLFHFLKLYSFRMNSVVYVFPKMDSFGEDLQFLHHFNLLAPLVWNAQSILFTLNALIWWNWWKYVSFTFLWIYIPNIFFTK